jgi:hypothetical protein
MKALCSDGSWSAVRARVPKTIVQFMVALQVAVAAIAHVPGEEAIAEDGGRGSVRSVRSGGIINVEAEGASVSDIIKELSRREGFEVDGDAPGEDVRLTRSLEGRLDELLAQLLRDGNYILVTDGSFAKRLIILEAGRATASPSRPSEPYNTVSVEQLRQKEGELLVLIARYEDMSEEAREHANPEFARKFKDYAQQLSREVEAVRARPGSDAR